MFSIILVLVPLLLLVGFFVLVGYETRQGVRLSAPLRSRLDEAVLRIEFIVANVDLAEFARSELAAFAHSIGHAVVHFTLRVVRAAERLLTRIVRWLRTRAVADEAPRATAREFVRTLSDFKDTLEATHPEIQDIEEVKKDIPRNIG